MKKLITTCLTICLSAALALPANALDYSIDAPGDPDYGSPTSIEVIYTADGGAMKNEDVSKNAALIPPTFGSPSADTLGTGTYLTPNLAPGGMAVGTITGGNMPVIFPPASDAAGGSSGGASTAAGYTYVTDDLYYSSGYLATLKIPSIGVNVKVYEGTGTTPLAKGAGHFTDTSIWDGNVCIAAHNRGAHAQFGKIHTLSAGDRVTLTTKLGTRTYEVTSVSKILETDTSGLTATTGNQITLYTCVANQPAYRWMVRAVEI